jgi:Fe-S-cluster containining protein
VADETEAEVGRGAVNPDAGALCQSCGLCCDGTLFARVPLKEGEVVPALVAAVTTPTRARFIPQRCAALAGTTCRCYEGRPLVCQQFECALLVAVRDEEVSLAEARGMVDKARTLEGQPQQDYLAFHFGRR